MKKIDTHVHTSEVSTCGKMTAAEMVDAYRRAGYDAIVITDHLILEKIKPQQLKPYEIVEQQLRGYLAAVAAAKGDIDVLLGAEIRFTSGHEDYLLLGLDEQKYFELARALPRLAAWRCTTAIPATTATTTRRGTSPRSTVCACSPARTRISRRTWRAAAYWLPTGCVRAASWPASCARRTGHT